MSLSNKKFQHSRLVLKCHIILYLTCLTRMIMKILYLCKKSVVQFIYGVRVTSWL